jgi:hypothetical protein
LFPQTFEECIRYYGLRHFKIKINGEAARDRTRLERWQRAWTECADDMSSPRWQRKPDVASLADYYCGLAGVPALNC